MRRYEPKTRYKISKSQIELLLVVLKYRFVSSDVLAGCLGKDRSTIYERLSVLVDQEYIVKLHDKTYRLRERPAIYYLAPKGIRHLKNIGQERTQLHYKNKTFTDEQIDEQFLLGELARTIQRAHEDRLGLITKYEHGEDIFYVSPPPYARLIGANDTIPDYFMEYIPRFYESWKLRRRINQHTQAAEESEYTYPYLLFVTGNTNTERRIITMTYSLLADFEIYTTTKERLMSGDTRIWLRAYETDDYQEPEYIGLPLRYEE